MPGTSFTFAVPRGSRYDDKLGVDDSLTLWRGLDPARAWNASNYSPVPSTTVHYSALRTEELSTAVSDRTSLPLLRIRFPGWKLASFTVGEARNAGYIAMRDPTNAEDFVLYARSDPDRPPPKGIAKALARIARIV